MKRFALLLLAACCAAAPDRLVFAILGDRTGDTQPGIYEQVWKEAAAEHPAFVLTVGDTIEGGNDAAAESEWREVQRAWAANSAIPLYLTPGNHDIWSAASEQLFRRFAGHPPHYSFDRGGVHVTVLDNSRGNEFAAGELDYLEADLKSHAAARIKMVISHRPSWIVNVAMRNPDFRLHRIAKEHGVQFVVAGHLHQIVRAEFEGVTYLSMPSAGGHLRLTKRYEDGWFFGHARVTVMGAAAEITIEETGPPYGQRRASSLSDWGLAGLVHREK